MKRVSLLVCLTLTPLNAVLAGECEVVMGEPNKTLDDLLHQVSIKELPGSWKSQWVISESLLKFEREVTVGGRLRTEKA